MDGMISPYTSNCKNVGMAGKTKDQFDNVNLDQSAICTPNPKTVMYENKNKLISIAFAHEANIIPVFRPNTTMAIDNADIMHPNL